MDVGYEQESEDFFYIKAFLIFQSKIPTFTPLEQGNFLSEKHRNEAGAEVGAFLGGLS